MYNYVLNSNFYFIWRCFFISNVQQMPRVNERIRVREVRLIDHEGKQLGVKPIDEAMGLARSVEMDLVEVSPSAAPPVCLRN